MQMRVISSGYSEGQGFLSTEITVAILFGAEA